MKKTRVLVIDDSAFNRRTISEMLEKSPHIEVIGTASDGEEGLKKAFSLKPDIITVDLEMPIMNGFTFLRLLMSRMPIPVIVVSSRDDDANVFKALDFGAVDFLAKPTARISRDLLNIEKDIISKVRMVSELRMDNIKKRVALKQRVSRVAKKEQNYIAPREGGTYDVLAIGSSTGGPPALQSIFTSLPKDLPLSVVVSQHMPKGFTQAFAERLNRLSDLRIKEAEDGDVLDKGSVLIAPGGTHMTLFGKGEDTLVRIRGKSLDDTYAPSIDKLFTSVSENYESRSIGLVLTGMGSDGKRGVIDLKKRGAYVMAESEESAIVYGMPKEAVNTGKVDKILPLEKIPHEIINLCHNKGLG
ncbi:MAG: chemotaxis response regulator protein-glutamate methylesterase [Deltaproteobacteria bacterium]|nr:chemotaxis response regulator protein-glutamate methylesterase [Deltaproteobacteria bacterium]